MITNLSCQVSEFVLEEEGQPANKLKELEQSIFQLVFQKQGLKQLYQPLRKGAQSSTKLKKDGRR